MKKRIVTCLVVLGMAGGTALAQTAEDDVIIYEDPWLEEQSTEPLVEEEERRAAQELEQGEDERAAQELSQDPMAEQDPYLLTEEEDRGGLWRGLHVTLNGGLEGYVADLATELNPGPSWGARVRVQPWEFLGVELGYSGAVNEIDRGVGNVNEIEGADIVRNGGDISLIASAGRSAVQPYVVGGIGFSHYDVRAPTPGFQDDTAGEIPVGLGLRTKVGMFTADARVQYGFPFSKDFAQDAGGDRFSGGRYAATIGLGGAF